MLNEIDLGTNQEMIELARKLGIPNPEEVVEIQFEDVGNGKARFTALYRDKQPVPDRIEL